MKTKPKRERLSTERSPLILIMAIACGITIANLYYNQPLLVLLATDFNTSAHAVGLIPTLTQIGYAIGILLLVPMGDLWERRRLTRGAGQRHQGKGIYGDISACYSVGFVYLTLDCLCSLRCRSRHVAGSGSSY